MNLVQISIKFVWFYLNRNLEPVRAKFDFAPCLTLAADVVRKKI
jgi:hypothetical protein